MDRASNFQKSDASLILASPQGFVTEQALRFNFNTSNNGNECEVLTMGLRMAKELGVRKLKIFTDSQLVIDQV